MLSRRDVVKLGAAGLIAPAIGSGAASSVSAAQQKSRDVPMFRGNAARTGEMPGPAPDGANGIEILWQFETGGQLRTPPAVVDGTAFLASRDGNLYALSVQDGTERWRFPAGEYFESGPAVADGIVYVGNEDGNLYALDASTGAEHWRFAAGTYAGSPAVVDGVIIAIGGSQGDMTLFALDTQDGSERWRFANEAGWYMAPAIAENIVFLPTGSTMHALDLRTGEEIWRATGWSDDVWFSPELTAANDVLYTPFGGGVSAIDAQTGTERWHTAPDQFITESIAVSDDALFAASGEYHTVAAASAHDGSRRWLYAIDGVEPDPEHPSRYGFGSVVVADGTVFAPRAFSELYAIDMQDGSERWGYSLPASGKNYLTAPVVVDGRILIGSSLDSVGTLYALGGRAARLEMGATARITSLTTLRGAPAPSGIARDDLQTDTLVTITGDAVITAGIAWWPVHIASTGQQGWVEASALEPVGAGG